MIERTLFNADHEAFRDSFARFIDLEAMGLLQQVGGGRSTRYYVRLPGWVPALT